MQTRNDGTHVISPAAAPIARRPDRAGLPVTMLRQSDGKVRHDGSSAANKQRNTPVAERGRLHGASELNVRIRNRAIEHRIVYYCSLEEERRWQTSREKYDRLRRRDKSACPRCHKPLAWLAFSGAFGAVAGMLPEIFQHFQRLAMHGSFGTSLAPAMSDGDKDFRIKPGRIRSAPAPRAAANRAGHMSGGAPSARRGHPLGQSTFGYGRNVFGCSRIFSSRRRVVIKARVARHQGRAYRSAPLTAHVAYLSRGPAAYSDVVLVMVPKRRPTTPKSAFSPVPARTDRSGVYEHSRCGFRYSRPSA